jgi:hypothetical protein
MHRYSLVGTVPFRRDNISVGERCRLHCLDKKLVVCRDTCLSLISSEFCVQLLLKDHARCLKL